MISNKKIITIRIERTLLLRSVKTRSHILSQHVPHGNWLAIVLHHILPVLAAGSALLQPNCTTRFMKFSFVGCHKQLDSGVLHLRCRQIKGKRFVPDGICRVRCSNGTSFTLLCTLVVDNQVQLERANE